MNKLSSAADASWRLLAWLAVLAACLAAASGQQAQIGGPGAIWLPTDMNYAVISNLAKTPLRQPLDQLSGYSVIGIIPTSDIAAYINQLNSNPSFRSGTVRWSPGVPSKCAYDRPGCTKSVEITVLEYSYVNPDASDCRAYALVAADAILPQNGILVDTGGGARVQPRGMVNYEILPSPNSTNTSCTYVVQYPRPTQLLANQLCDGSCFNTPCQPCNANQTVQGSDPPTNCMPTSGIAPQLVAAIQGAAQCLAVGALGRYQCQASPGTNTSGCAQMACFPGDASVVTEHAGRQRMSELRIGDRVQVVREDGSFGWDDIYFFGHKSPDQIGEFIKITLASRSGERAIELSAKHFLPVGGSTVGGVASAAPMRAGDVRPGDTAWAAGPSGTAQHRVLSVETVRRRGLWAPHTLGGSIVVDGVAASVHSDWYLDPVFDVIGRPDLLPRVYQALLAPVRLLYRALGPESMRHLDGRLDLAEALLSPSRVLSGAAVVAAASLLVARSIAMAPPARRCAL